MFGCLRGNDVRPRKDLVDVIHQLRKGLRFSIARLRKLDAEVGADVSGVAPQHHDAIGQQHCFFNVVRYQEDRLGGHGLLGPKLQQFAAQVLGGEHVESREWLVHEQDFRLNHQRAGKAYPLLHAARQFFGIGGFKPVQTDRIQHLHAPRATLFGVHAACLQGRFDILKHREPGEKRKALEDDGDIGLRAGNRLSVPIDLPCRRSGEPAQHAQHGGLAGAGRPQQRQNFSGQHAQIGSGDYLNPVLAGLCVEFFNLLGANDGVARRDLRRVRRRRHGRGKVGEVRCLHASVSGMGSAWDCRLESWPQLFFEYSSGVLAAD